MSIREVPPSKTAIINELQNKGGFSCTRAPFDHHPSVGRQGVFDRRHKPGSADEQWGSLVAGDFEEQRPESQLRSTVLAVGEPR